MISISGQRSPRTACASAQCDQVLRCPFTESFDTVQGSESGPERGLKIVSFNP